MPRSKNVDSWMSEQDPSIRQIAKTLRNILLSVEPGLRESIKWSNPVYENKGKVAYLSATQRYVTLGFLYSVKGGEKTYQRGGAKPYH